MPSPLKERPSGSLGRLLAALRPSRAGPLPVQTGFPTSLADLVVKNHGRLKKPSSASSKRRKGDIPPSPSPSPPPSSPPPPPPAATVPPSDRPRADLSPAQAVRRNKDGAFGLGLGFLTVSGVVSLALLVIWSKKVVAAVTVASFSLFLLESVRSSSLPWRPLSAATKRQLYLEGRGRVSPIQEVEAKTEPSRPSCSDSDRGTEVSIFAIEERSGVLDESSIPKAKTKKRSWRKLIASAKKLHKGRRPREADSLGSFRSEGDQADATVRGNAKATDSSDSHRGMANQTDVVADAIAKEPDSLGDSRRGKAIEIDARAIEIDVPADLNEEDRAGFRFPALVLVAVVLVGLVAGKFPAVAFTVLCSAYLRSVQRLPSGGGGLHVRRLELSMS
ncbi:uncharacterized protein LOC133913021 [Phragmites australis]|uniref:uncharacterized protein LOC133913021 n=1 Tax=Phragmites australis TaxID=29695 RepID=UPI002D7839E8|nr:uncharacterized protein LOC133913021 [Phragmites australis]